MSNYLVLHKSSNLITNVVCSSFILTESNEYRFIKVPDQTLDRYYRLKMRKASITLVDVGELMDLSNHVFDQVSLGRKRSTGIKKVVLPRSKPESPVLVGLQ